MNSLTRSVLTLASYDKNCSDTSIENVLRQCLGLIAVFPMLAVYGYHAYNHYSNDESMYIHRPQKKLSTAENLLMMLRPDKQYTELEAKYWIPHWCCIWSTAAVTIPPSLPES